MECIAFSSSLDFCSRHLYWFFWMVGPL
jgi:hypothetical protein